MIPLPYISLVFTLFIFYTAGNINKSLKYELLTTAIVIFAIFFGFRGYIFTDVFGYYNFYQRVPSFLASEKAKEWLRHSWWEPGFTYYISFFKIFTSNYSVFLFFDTMINLILLYKGLEWFSSNNCINYMLFIASGVFVFANNVRNIKAILLFLIALRYIYERRLINYTVLCVLAILFHSVSIIYIPLYFILSKKMSYYIIAIMIIISFIMFIMGENIFISFFSTIVDRLAPAYSSRISTYLLSDTFSGGRGLTFGFIEKILTLLLILLVYRKVYVNKNVIIVNCFFLYFLLYFAFSGFVTVANRLSNLFLFTYWIIWPECMKVIRTKQVKSLFLISLLSYSLLKCCLYNNHSYKYENILTGAMTIDERKRYNNQ